MIALALVLGCPSLGQVREPDVIRNVEVSTGDDRTCAEIIEDNPAAWPAFYAEWQTGWDNGEMVPHLVDQSSDLEVPPWIRFTFIDANSDVYPPRSCNWTGTLEVQGEDDLNSPDVDFWGSWEVQLAFDKTDCTKELSCLSFGVEDPTEVLDGMIVGIGFSESTSEFKSSVASALYGTTVDWTDIRPMVFPGWLAVQDNGELTAYVRNYSLAFEVDDNFAPVLNSDNESVAYQADDLPVDRALFSSFAYTLHNTSLLAWRQY